jgi:hypothetical protein
MATQIKVKVVRTPNMDFPAVGGEEYKDLEQDIEKAIENKLEGGYTYVGAAGGDSFIILIFSKET